MIRQENLSSDTVQKDSILGFGGFQKARHKNFVYCLFFIILFLALGVCLKFKTASIYAQEEVASSEEEIRLYIGQTKVLPTETPKRIAIGDPKVVDIASVTKDTIILSPKAAGQTTLEFWDTFGQQSYNVRVLTDNPGEIKARIDSLLKEINLPNVYTKTVESEGKVLLLGDVKTEEEKGRIDLVLGPLMGKVTNLVKIKEETIVSIDVLVLEVQKDATRTLGFLMPGTINVTEPPNQFSKKLINSLDAMFHVFDWQRTNFSATVDFLVSEGKARILSQPRLACLSGKEAQLLVGGEKPTFTTSIASGGSTTSVSYRQFGIQLNIRPTVVEKGKIQLGLKIEVSEVGDVESIGGTNYTTASAYPLSKRNVATELFLNDGQTLSIGGLIKQKKTETTQKIPILGDIPVIGAIFRHKVENWGGGKGEKADSELFIMLTPKIVSEKKDLDLKTTTRVLEEENPADPVAAYTNTVKKLIIDNLTYPALAVETGIQGALKLRIHLAYSGELLEVLIKESSGYKILDDHALSVVHGIASYPPFPSSVDLNELWIDIPIAYNLE